MKTIKAIEDFKKNYSCEFGQVLGSCGCGACSSFNAIIDAYQEARE